MRMQPSILAYRDTANVIIIQKSTGTFVLLIQDLVQAISTATVGVWKDDHDRKV